MQEAGQSYPFQVVNHSERGTKRSVVLVSAEAAVAYCDWQSQTALDGGYLSELEYIFPKMKADFENPKISNESKKKQWHPFRTVVMHIPFARIELSSEPEGALVQIDGQYQGVTPILIDSIKPGSVEVNMMLEGYRRHRQLIQLKGRENKKLSVTLQRNNSVVFGQKWQNSLGMQLVPLAEDLLISVWETRKIDYLAFCKDSKKPVSPLPAFSQGSRHPVVNVSRVDADAFCAWLTERERKLERISDDEKYRLLTDLEWSLAAGLDDNPDYLPSRREMRAEKTFPWGRVWPPEDVDVLVGNLSGKTASKAEDMPRERTLILYDDGYEKTSPVGMFSPNAMGIYDLAGNVSEWVSDDYAEDREYGVLRGGNWGSYLAKHLYVTSRNAVKSTKTGDRYGFRVVLAKKKPRLTNELQEDDALIQEP
jgi:formylglycine-generating enzyme required for sulfatase activity